MNFERIFWSTLMGAMILAWALFMCWLSLELEVAELGIREQEIQATMKIMIRERRKVGEPYSMKVIRQKAIKELKRLEGLL